MSLSLLLSLLLPLAFFLWLCLLFGWWPMAKWSNIIGHVTSPHPYMITCQKGHTCLRQLCSALWIKLKSKVTRWLFNPKFMDHLGSIHTIRNLSRQSGKFPGYLENIQIIHKLSRPSGNLRDGLESSQCNFKGYAQKLSEWQCHDGFCDSAVRFGHHHDPPILHLRASFSLFLDALASLGSMFKTHKLMFLRFCQFFLSFFLSFYIWFGFIL